ncbi:DUF1700 domain-containing protein [Hazenella sp. IB182357]|uniref:DUF1700 domain-containing protein n=1 Tax=Polycladospora coralii TaxID=2771432 RepID=A0A926RW39_9BACL|nr:DUF1700 domain-containing protein [Polycladospora coralii]MBD1371086.1 DUF1700 domain-containing protein [Polycladospora coralii]
MNKDHFLNRLETALHPLSDTERNDILKDYEEYFSIGLASGKKEEEITQSLGSPSQIAKELLATYHVEKVEANVNTQNLLRAILAVIALGFFNFIFVLGPLFTILGSVLSGWLASFILLIAPFFLLLKNIFIPENFLYFELFISIASCGLGILAMWGMYFATKALWKLFIRYLKFNISVIRGGL